MNRSRKIGTCVYCGNIGPVTGDHVPPKCLFPPGCRLNLITVPACSCCNGSFKLDDEYFRSVLSLRADLPEGATGDFLRAATTRALKQPAASGLRSAVLRNVRSRALHSTGGIYLGHAPTYQVDYGRLKATAGRVIRGLFYHFFKGRVPDTHAVTVVFTELQRDNSVISNPVVQELIGLLGQTNTYRESTNVLELWARTAEDDANSSFWYVRILKTLGFFAFTAPEDG